MRLASVPISEIEVVGRARQDFGDIVELAQDIRENGLISPITLKEVGENEYKLLAGERRLRACKFLKHETISARIYQRELTEREQLCIELSENLRRKDFTPIEEIALKKRIHDLHVAEYGEKTVKTSSEGWSGTDTARFLGENRANTHRDLQLAKFMAEFPDLGWEQLKSKSDCHKLMGSLSKQATISMRVAEVERERATGTIKQHTQRLVDSYIVGDFFEHAKKMEPETFDLIECDPPYAIDLREVKKGYGYGSDYNEIVRNKYPEFIGRSIKESYRLLKPGGWLLQWFAPEPWFEQIYELLRANNFNVHRICGIWTKPSGQSHQPSTYLASSYEMFFYAKKGDARIHQPGRSNVFQYSPVSPARKVHPTERPKELIEELLRTFALPGSRVLVPFAGSGATLRAAHALGMKPVGFDLTESFRNAFVAGVMEDHECSQEET